ncbi:MAG: cation:proton antiporter [Desulfobacterales bacterium]|nr:cation:proton antiporter [Desulfobacterales bacterium]
MLGASTACSYPTVVASIAESNAGTHFLWIAIILLVAKLANLVVRYGQPPVLGELLVGVVFGNLGLAGIHFFDPIRGDSVIRFLAELGVVILLFQVGLESNIQKMLRVGPRALLVACVGVLAPFMLGTFVVGPFLLPELSFNACLLLGAILTATSVGITARVFSDLGKIQIPEAQIVLGAALIDDVLALAILAVVKAIVEFGNVSFIDIGWIIGKAVFFLGSAIFLGQVLASRLGDLFSKVNPGIGMKFILAVSFALFFAYLAEAVGLAPIVGGFAAGLVLEPVYFSHFDYPAVVKDIDESVRTASPDVKKAVSGVLYSFSRSHIQDLVKPLGYFLVPIFFVLTGMEVRLETLCNPSVLLLALVIAVVAFVGKIAAGLVAGRVNKAIIGWGMVPRGEVALIFAAMGKSMGVVSDEIFSMIVMVIMLTTIVPPPILNFLLQRKNRLNSQSRNFLSSI